MITYFSRFFLKPNQQIGSHGDDSNSQDSGLEAEVICGQTEEKRGESCSKDDPDTDDDPCSHGPFGKRGKPRYGCEGERKEGDGEHGLNKEEEEYVRS